MKLGKTYLPSEIETKWYRTWEENGYFKPSMNKNAQSYCIMLPPPNVTGTLHMGHAFQQTIMDILIRYHRMKGFNTLWQPGTDHAGISTQIVVERQLDNLGSSRTKIGREAFNLKVWEWKKISGDTITRQMRRLGASCDWSRERFTMDEGLCAAVNEVFIGLYNKGLIYRGKRLVNWDVRRQTSVSDLEVRSVEENGSMWHIRYPIKNSTESIIIATTRPETMLGDVAVAVNPEDQRYKHLIGKSLILPLVGREIPIIADDYVDAEFGTGCVKITPAHDFNDYEIGKRHDLEMINIFTLDGRINQNAPAKYQGLERFNARKQIVADLEAEGWVVEVKPHKLMVPRGEKDDVILEPMLTEQWFMKMDKLAERGLELVEDNSIRFVPDNWKKTYNQWLKNIQDWCISRQLWWGHRIPAYYDEAGNIYVAPNRQEAEKIAKTQNLTQDNDVLDTWFSSSLWCFSTLGWPKQTAELEMFLPSSVLVTGFDIIFFWVARMIMLTDEFIGKAPFKEVYINGLIMDAHGEKMSKSKGNIIDPLDIIDGISPEELVTKRTANLLNPRQAESIAKQTKKDYPDGFLAFGADALRFSLANLATQSRYINFDLKRLESSRNFCNKLFNAAKFVLMNVDNHKELIGRSTNKSVIDDWILLELAKLIADVEAALKTYRFDIASQRIYEFVWNEMCDWYLELAKVNLQSSDETVRAGTINTLLSVLEAALRIIHPFMPFISEELWQAVAPIAGKNSTASIVISEFPTAGNYTIADSAPIMGQIEQLKQITTIIRNLRSEMGLQPANKVPLIIETQKPELFTVYSEYVKILAKISEISLVDALPESSAPIAVIQEARMMLKIEIDAAAEKARLSREIEKHNREVEKMQVKLINPNYLERAPTDLVARDKARVDELTAIIRQLDAQLTKLN